MHLKGRPLAGQEILEAQHLLYQVYCEQLQWLPPEGNKSAWHLAKNPFGSSLADDFDMVAHWFGVRDGDQLVAVARAIKPVDNQLEVERYHSIPGFLRKSPSKNIELNRFAIDERYQDSQAIVWLALLCFEFISRQSASYVMIAPTVPSPADLLASLGFQEPDAASRFRYHPGDQDEVALMYLDASNAVLIEAMIAKCRGLLNL
ncbi:GNAT family N-acyltransferase [Pseudobacteriovorax antillogorgiicola]|uniref:Acetyltransferase (GNAT) domain-containing protein n=1 Tax=Pseudobacteriovorax antillogorgiicola TaxID=1513793 RepID=A0A1Y6BFI9_9BACT|nr:GNAT family N-acyltransferase [Pseudobacteriovorax antillogorgiicola]TCS57372.1 acetyltransferase (GNAT) family protein [Pseudobacteriovorax antillogorgiicola]SMF01903.1 Acetyltransferase (GNAT) domain-containing protein [Pseudobacteriovorax antillogorgiicola]